MAARFTHSGARSGGKRRIWCSKHSRWHSAHVARHCAGEPCPRVEKGTCPLQTARAIPAAARKKLPWLLR